jgi:hypothetical protein
LTDCRDSLLSDPTVNGGYRAAWEAWFYSWRRRGCVEIEKGGWAVQRLWVRCCSVSPVTSPCRLFMAVVWLNARTDTHTRFFVVLLVNMHVHARETSHQTTEQVLYNYPNEIRKM